MACHLPPSIVVKQEQKDPCYPNPCGSNALCTGEGICSCLTEYQGDPYIACKPECVLSSECSISQACINKKCIDPCPGTCGFNAVCEVVNHIPMCHCTEGMTGNAFVLCQAEQQSMLLYSKNCIKSRLILLIIFT